MRLSDLQPSDGRASVALVKWSELSPAERASASRRIRLEAASAGAGPWTVHGEHERDRSGRVPGGDPVSYAAGVERMIQTFENGYERRRREHVAAVRLELVA